MDTVFEAFLSWQFLFFCISIGAIVFVIRQVVEYAMINWWPLKQWAAANKDSKLWTGLILPIMPILLGPLMAVFITQLPYPEEFSTNESSKFVFGLVAGFLSGFVVKLFKSYLSYKASEYSTTTTTNTMTMTPTTTVVTTTPTSTTVEVENTATDVKENI